MKLPTLDFEQTLWKKGFKFVCGIDEVGRGSFAGPIYAASVIFSPGVIVEKVVINDSKKLSAKQREKASIWIKKNALYWGVGQASVWEINRNGIVKASQKAFRRAITKVNNVDFLLIDAFYIPYVKRLRRKNQKAIIKGDCLSISIAAASILAKVERDKYMKEISKIPNLKIYKFHKNKGYGTKEHQIAIKKHGITKHHRKMFVETFLRG